MPEENLPVSQPIQTTTIPSPMPVQPPIQLPPQTAAPKSKTNLLLIVIIVLLLISLLGGGIFFYINSLGKKKETNSYQSPTSKTTTSNSSSNESTSTQTTPKSDVVFDVPFFLNKTRDEVKAILGKPETDYSDPQSPGYGYTRYVKNNYSMQVEYRLDNAMKQTVFGYIGIGVANSTPKATILKELNLEEISSVYEIGIKRWNFAPKDISSVYVFPKGSKYYNPSDFSN